MNENKSGVGSIIGIIVIIAIIVLGGLYFWGKRIEESKAVQQMTTDTPTVLPTQSETNTMSSSDDLSSIETDLKNTQTTGLDSEINSSVQ